MAAQLSWMFSIFGFSILITGCSSLLMRQGYRLDPTSRSEQVKDVCSDHGEKYEGAELNTSDVQIQMSFENRERSSFAGPLFLPFIPIGLSENKNITLIVTVKNSPEALKTDFNFWQFSFDGKNWSFPAEINPVTLPADSKSSPNKVISGTQIISRLDMIGAETVFMKTASMTVGSKKIPPMTLKWHGEDYSRYTPLIVGMDAEAKSTMVCQ
jgi:hypothetical protein